MARLSVSNAWDEGTRFASREFRLLYPVALLLMELPVLLVVLIAPNPDVPDLGGVVDPRALIERIGLGTFILTFVVLGLLVFAVQTLGSMTISLLALRPGTSVGEALAVATRRLPAMLAALLLLGVAGVILMMPVMLLAIGSLGTRPTVAAGASFFFLFLVFLIFFLALGARLTVMTPVAVAEPVGPLGIIRRSWSLTAGHFWKLLGTLVLIGVVYLIVFSAVGFALNLLTWATVGRPETNATAAFVYQLLMSLFTAGVAVFFISFVARIYAQLSGRAEEVGQVFT